MNLSEVGVKFFTISLSFAVSFAMVALASERPQVELVQFKGGSQGGGFGPGPSAPPSSLPSIGPTTPPSLPNAPTPDSSKVLDNFSFAAPWSTPVPQGYSKLPEVRVPKTYARPKIAGIDPNAHCCPSCMCGGTGADPIVGPSVGPPDPTPPPPKFSGIAADTANMGGADKEGSYASRNRPFSFASTVALQYENAAVKCSGVLVSKTRVLTAAHCLCGGSPYHAFFGETVYQDIAAKSGPALRTSLSLKLDHTYFNPDFCKSYQAAAPSSPFPRGDLALLALQEQLPKFLADAILPVERRAGASDSVERLFGVGFGEADARWAPGVKNYARLRFTERICPDAKSPTCHPKIESIATSHDATKSADSCYADSGGPLFAQQSENGPMRLIGIVSRGLKLRKDQMCGDGGIYTSLEAPEVRTWLDQQLATAN